MNIAAFWPAHNTIKSMQQPQVLKRTGISTSYEYYEHGKFIHPGGVGAKYSKFSAGVEYIYILGPWPPGQRS